MTFTKDRLYCLLGSHKYEILERLKVRYINTGEVGLRYTLRCSCCGKVTKTDI